MPERLKDGLGLFAVQEALRAGGLANRHHLRRQILLGNERMPYDIGKPFHHVFKLTDVAGPRVTEEHIHSPIRNPQGAAPEGGDEVIEEMVDQKRDVRTALWLWRMLWSRRAVMYGCRPLFPCSR